MKFKNFVKKFKNILAPVLILVIVVIVCLSFKFGVNKSISIYATTSDAEHTFNFWLPKLDGTGVGGDYDNYNQNPGVVYMTEKDWTYKSAVKNGNSYTQGEEVTNKVALDFFTTTAVGQEQNSFITSLNSGNIDILEMSYATSTVLDMYSNGKAMDITYWVENYMPNYKKYIEDNGFYSYATNEVNGERKFLQLYGYQDNIYDYFYGYQYRRDWILKFGVDPSQGNTTGQTFAEVHSEWGWQEVDGNKTWIDGITFPSWYGYKYTSDGTAKGMGTLTYDETLNTYIHGEYKTYMDTQNVSAKIAEEYQGQWPATISDWEWMLDIFQIALDKLGYNNLGYGMSIYQSGVVNSGNLLSSFGGGNCEWYKKDGDVVFGLGSSTVKTYAETMNQWYKNGWIDTGFQSHSDLFWRTDENTVRQGYVGLYYGMNDQLFDGMDQSNGVTSNPTHGLCSYGMPYPINDKYGTAENMYKMPDCFYAMSKEVSSYMFTKDLENSGKDLASLFTMLDWLYGEEGSNIKGWGLTAAQLETCQSGIQQLYKKYGCEDGSAQVIDGRTYRTDAGNALTNDQQYALKHNRLCGVEAYVPHYKDLDDDIFRLQLWNCFKEGGFLEKSFFNQLNAAQYKLFTNNQTTLRNNIASELPKFIKGDRPMSQWDSWVSTLSGQCSATTMTTMLNNLLHKLEG